MIIHHLPSLKKRTMRLSLYFDTKDLRSANFSRIVITILAYAIEFHLLNERDLIATLAHNILTFRAILGRYPSRAVNELILSQNRMPPFLRML